MIYEHHATAATAQRFPIQNLEPGQVREIIEPATTVVATAHYQAMILLTCGTHSDVSCIGDFPSPGSNNRLNVARISCVLEADPGSRLDYGVAELRTSAQARLVDVALPAYSIGPDGYQTTNNAVDLQVSANRHISMFLTVSNSTPLFAFCTATGTLDTLG